MATALPARWQLPSKTSSAADVVRINLAGTRYSVVKMAAEELGIVASDDGATDCNVYWIDSVVPLEKFLELKPYQRINHFPGMGEISRKDSIARSMQRMQRVNRYEYHFFPTTWVLPADHGSLGQHVAALHRWKRRRTFIVKPHNGSMGNGIYLTQSPEAIPQGDRVVVQQYLDKPFLLEGFKCDLRIYVLVTSCNPLRIFVYKDGLVRLSTQQYSPPSEANLDQCFMHLTNYSVNKQSESFDRDEREDRGSKRTLRFFIGWLRRNGYNVVELWAKIHDVIIKTLLLAHPNLVHSYTVHRPGQLPDEKSQFFEILGFDIILDHTLQPWLLEVNRSPSFGTDTNLDLHIKTGVIRDALGLANIRPSDKQRDTAARRVASRRRLSYAPSRTTPTSAQYNFQAEQDMAANEKKQRRLQVKEHLSKLRREREFEQYEDKNMGDYVRVYPTSDPIKGRLYSRLMEDSLSASGLGKSGSVKLSRSSQSVSGRGQLVSGRDSGCGHAVVGDMKEHELLDLLSQYEDEDSGTSPWNSGLSQRRPSTSSFQPPALQESSPMAEMFSVMATQLQEEEQTQRTMVALKEMAPFYPGRSQSEVQAVLEQIHAEFTVHRASIATFWLATLNKSKRKQLLAPVRETVKCLLYSHWRRADLSKVRLHLITSRLMAFLVGRGGEGLWASVSPADKSSWEASFKKKQDVISVAEMACCQRIVELSQCLLFTAYHYHCLKPPHSKIRSTSSFPSTQCPSLPHLKRRPLLTTPPGPRPPRAPSSIKTTTGSRNWTAVNTSLFM